MIKVDLGGVGSGDPNWLTVNVDTSGYRPAPDLVADITVRAGELDRHFEPGSLDMIRAAHTLEHLPAYDILPTLQYWRTFLKANGALLIIVPDLGQMAIDYADGRIPMEVFAGVAYVTGFRTVQGPQEEHRAGWDFGSLGRLLVEAGYGNVREASDVDWPASWVLDYPDLVQTGCVGRYMVPNLRVIADA